MEKNSKTKKISLIILICEALLILASIPFLFFKNDIYNFNASDFLSGGGELNENSVYAGNGNECDIVSKTFALPRGVYRIALNYKTDADQKNTVKVTAGQASYNSVRTNPVVLYSGKNQTDYLCYITEKNNDLSFDIHYSGEGSIEVYGAIIKKTNIFAREFIFTLLVLFVIIDVAWVLYNKGFFDRERNIRILLLSGCVSVSCIPLMTDYMMSGSDYIYHLLRIEGVKDGILAGCFPVRIYPEWVYGYGYIDAVMYGNFFLYIPALFRLIGFDVTASYKMFVVVINILTVMSSYVCFKKMTGDRKAALLGTYLFVLMPYRYSALYNLSRVGIFCAAVFFPVVLLGMYKIFTQDEKEKSFKYNWIITSAGICGILWNHVLSTEITGLLIIFFCIVFIKRTFRIRRFVQLLLSAVSSFLASLWYIIPFLDNYINQDLQIKNVYERTIQNRGIHPAQFFALFVSQDTNSTMYGYEGLQGALNLTYGFALLFGLFIFMLVLFGKKEEQDKKNIKTGIVFVVSSVLLSWMCTLFFPWDFLQQRNAVFKMLISSLQFPSRLIIFAGIFLTVVSMAAFLLLRKNEKRADIFAGVTMLLCVAGALYYSSELLNNATPYKLYDVAEFGTGFTSGSEYIFNDIKSNYNDILTYRDAAPSDNVNISVYSKDGLDVVVGCENTSDENGFVDLPMLFYIGYSAKDLGTGETMNCIFGDRCDIRVIIPPGYSGNFEVKYTGKGYWRIGDTISLITIAATGLYLTTCIKKKKEQ
ncbi:MAG: hypothetical protein K5776_12930 [Lachnospiraceae bacterium]|nr:hypothetical protein [Lachnospiraceae bacterium]